LRGIDEQRADVFEGYQDACGGPRVPRELLPVRSTTVEIVLLDQERQPVRGEAFLITVPDSRVKTGTLDKVGFKPPKLGA
jgi:hypothetical protein